MTTTTETRDRPRRVRVSGPMPSRIITVNVSDATWVAFKDIAADCGWSAAELLGNLIAKHIEDSA